MAYLTQHQNMDNFLETLVRDPLRYEPIIQFLDNIIQNSDELSWFELESIGLEVSESLCSEFCSQVRKGMMKALDNSKTSSGQLEAAKVFARQMTASPDKIAESHIAELRLSGLSDQSIEDIVGWVCILQFYSVMDQALGFKGLPQPVITEITQGTVQQQGYLPSFNYFISMAPDQQKQT